MAQCRTAKVSDPASLSLESSFFEPSGRTRIVPTLRGVRCGCTLHERPHGRRFFPAVVAIAPISRLRMPRRNIFLRVSTLGLVVK